MASKQQRPFRNKPSWLPIISMIADFLLIWKAMDSSNPVTILGYCVLVAIFTAFAWSMSCNATIEEAMPLVKVTAEWITKHIGSRPHQPPLPDTGEKNGEEQ